MQAVSFSHTGLKGFCMYMLHYGVRENEEVSTLSKILFLLQFMNKTYCRSQLIEIIAKRVKVYFPLIWEEMQSLTCLLYMNMSFHFPLEFRPQEEREGFSTR